MEIWKKNKDLIACISKQIIFESLNKNQRSLWFK